MFNHASDLPAPADTAHQRELEFKPPFAYAAYSDTTVDGDDCSSGFAAKELSLHLCHDML